MDALKHACRNHKKLKTQRSEKNNKICVAFWKKVMLWKFCDAHKGKNLSNKGQEKTLL